MAHALDPLLKLLQQVQSGELSAGAAQQQLAAAGMAHVDGVACMDLGRAARRGIPEVIYGQSKTVEQLKASVAALLGAGQTALVTRVDEPRALALKQAFPQGEHNPLAHTFMVRCGGFVDVGRGEVLVVCAGTSDLPVAEEAAVTLDALGHRVGRITDVGVAGLQRILAHQARLNAAAVILVVAGMEGALPSVVAGLCGRPVIAVPTSVGYGTAFGGVTALLGMLNACSSGITVVNIDNGFGAAFAAALINRRDAL